MAAPDDRKEGATKIVQIGRCPICRIRAALDAHPFCTKRCADIDLSRWLGGAYAIPAGESGEDEFFSEEDLGTPPDRNLHLTGVSLVVTRYTRIGGINCI